MYRVLPKKKLRGLEGMSLERKERDRLRDEHLRARRVPEKATPGITLDTIATAALTIFAGTAGHVVKHKPTQFYMSQMIVKQPSPRGMHS